MLLRFSPEAVQKVSEAWGPSRNSRQIILILALILILILIPIIISIPNTN